MSWHRQKYIFYCDKTGFQSVNGQDDNILMTDIGQNFQRKTNSHVLCQHDRIIFTSNSEKKNCHFLKQRITKFLFVSSFCLCISIVILIAYFYM